MHGIRAAGVDGLGIGRVHPCQAGRPASLHQTGISRLSSSVRKARHRLVQALVAILELGVLQPFGGQVAKANERASTAGAAHGFDLATVQRLQTLSWNGAPISRRSLIARSRRLAATGAQPGTESKERAAHLWVQYPNQAIPFSVGGSSGRPQASVIWSSALSMISARSTCILRSAVSARMRSMVSSAFERARASCRQRWRPRQ